MKKALRETKLHCLDCDLFTVFCEKEFPGSGLCD